MKGKAILRTIALITAVTLFCAGGAALGYNYNPCRVPPVVGVGVLPNVMLLMDSSGNMALPAYFPINTTSVASGNATIIGPDPTNANQYYSTTNVFDGVSTTLNTAADYTGAGPTLFPAYDPRVSYFGIFRPEKYYVYNATSHYFQLTATANAPAKEYTITASLDGGNQTFAYTDTTNGTNYTQTTYYIKFTTSTGITDVAVGDLVSFAGLNSHSCLNGYTYEVTAVSGTSLTVAVKVKRAHTVNGAAVDELVVPGPAGVQWWDGTAWVTPPAGCWWNGKGDTEGTVAKRVNTGMDFFTKGVSGSILNFATTSRLDAGLVALIGGREEYPAVAGDTNNYIKTLGSRWFVEEATNINAGLYVRPAKLKDCTGTVQNYPNDYSTVCTGDTFQSKTSFLTVFGKYSSYLDGNDPAIQGEPAEGWKFKLPFAATVKITLKFDSSTWPTVRGARLVIYTDQGWGSIAASGAADINITSGNTASLSVNLPASATYYYVRVASKDDQGGQWMTSGQAYKYTLYANVPLEADTYPHTANSKLASYHQGWGGGSIQMPVPATGGAAVTWATSTTPAVPRTNIGAVPFADVRVAIPSTVWQRVRYGSTGCALAESTLNANQPLPACPRGLVQDSFNMVRFGFAFFSSYAQASKTFKGKILIGCENRNMQYLLYAMQGIEAASTAPWSTDSLDFSTVLPYGSPPTGPALDCMVDYFQMATNSSGADNSLFTARALQKTPRDPYYDAASQAVPCRKSFIIMVSTGMNSDNPDPTIAVSHMHGLDVRPDTQWGDLPGTQDVKVYTIYAFASDPPQCDTDPTFTPSQMICGRRAMKTVSSFGGYTNISGCGSVSSDKPYTFGSTPNNSSNVYWPRCESGQCCDPNGTFDMPCCQEWNKVWDRDGDQINEAKGIPDNYYEASDGKQLQSALMKILFEIVSVNAAASAVATVSQEIKSGDVIVRGAFRATDPETLNKFLWYGHLESFWPDPTKNNKYDFEYSCNRGLLCYEMPGPAFLGTPGDCPSTRLPNCWDGASFLTENTGPRGVRKIFTGYDSNGDGKIAIDQSTWIPEQIDFTATNASQLQSLLSLNVAMNDCDASGAIDSADVNTFINWVRGIDNNFYRLRVDFENTPWQLGDLVYSTPVVSGLPPLGGVSPKECTNCFASEYWAYRNLLYQKQTANRTAAPANIHDCVKQMVYVGANDGMIHAFVLAVYDWSQDKWIFQKDLTNAYAKYIGEELWAYIPSNLLSELKYLASSTNYGQGTCAHRTMVDLSPHVWQVYMKSDCNIRDVNGATVNYANTADTASGSKCWRSVLIGGERGGGDVYFAIDVSDPDNPKLLWEHSVLKDMLTYASGQFSSAFTSGVYDDLKILPMTWSKPTVGRISLPSDVRFYTGNPNSSGTAQGAFPFSGPRHVAFIGGGFRVFDTTYTTSAGTVRDITPLLNPDFLAIDVETGQNLFRYVWPYLLNGLGTAKASPFFPSENRGTNSNPYYVPYAMSDPLVLDLWNENTSVMGDDGLHDHIYVGDLHGNFYTMKFHLGSSQTQKGIWIDVRRTRKPNEPNSISSGDPYSFFRSGTAQPITVQPVASVDANTPTKVRVIFGTGKFDDIEGSNSDKADATKMSIYNMGDTIDLSQNMPISTPTFGGQIISGSNFYLYGKLLCDSTAFANRSCIWRTSSGTPDSCGSTCWDCVFDLTVPPAPSGSTLPSPGERIINKALIAGGLVFVTSYVPPSNACNYAGNSYLYIFDYMCSNPATINFNNVLQGAAALQSFNSSASGQAQTYGVQLSLGSGMASMPILDTSGQNVIIQLSDASLMKTPVTLPIQRTQSKGWVER
jgi:Tfp pilus tip-associated adhesin PilY1